MAALLQVIRQWNYEQLESQLMLCDQCRGTVKDSISEFLISCGIDSLENLTEELLIEYRNYLMNSTEGTIHHKKYYFHVLQLCVVSYFSLIHPEFSEKIAEYSTGELPDRNRVAAYLMVNGIFSFDDVTADVRDGLFQYITNVLQLLPYRRKLVYQERTSIQMKRLTQHIIRRRSSRME